MKIKRKFSFPLALIVTIVMVVFFLFVVGNISETSTEEQRASLETALIRAVVHSYAVEGSYPESLEYIKENYGLTYNEEKFFIDYQPIASNIMPDISIIEK